MFAHVPTELSKLIDVVKMMFLKKLYTMLQSLIDIEDNIPSITNLATNTVLNAKINEVKGKNPNITNLATTAARTTVENKIPNVRDFVKKANYDAKVSKIEKKVLLLLIIINLQIIYLMQR